PATTEHNKNEHLTIARHEVYCTLEDVVKACKLHVRPGGKVAMVHRPGRLVDILTLFRAYKLEPKRMQLVYSKKGRDANMLLVEGIRDGKADLTILPPLYIYRKMALIRRKQRVLFMEEHEHIVYILKCGD